MIDVCQPAVHEAIKTDDAVWSRLRFIGFQELPAESASEPAESFEVRNCACHSTLYRKVVTP